VLLFALDPTPLFPDVLRVTYLFVFSITHVFRDTRYFLAQSTTNKEREKEKKNRATKNEQNNNKWWRPKKKKQKQKQTTEQKHINGFWLLQR
jgi:hypothetical protein